MSTTAPKPKPARKKSANGNGAASNGAASVEAAYRDKWRWDNVFWATHCVDCYPGNCPYRVYRPRRQGHH